VEEFLSAAEVVNRRKLAVDLIRGQMGRPLLAAKVERGVNLAIAKAARKAEGRRPRAEKKKTEATEARAYKLGRWEYPVRVTRAGSFERNSKRDGSGAWVPADLTNGTLVY